MHDAPALREKHALLLRSLSAMGRAAVAFSGGVDSTLLLHAAHRALPRGVLAVTFSTPYMAETEIREAREAAQALGAAHRVVPVAFPEALRDNPAERCYLCKRQLFGLLLDLARHEGIDAVLDGTNLDDMGEHRPGLRALRELGVQSPLRDAGLTKRDVRDLSREYGLPTWDKPAAACLLTRIPHGTRIGEAELRRIDAGEAFLKACGFPAVRLRSHGDLARIEVPRERVAELLDADRRHGLDAHLKALGYRHVCVDLAGYRTGSLGNPET